MPLFLNHFRSIVSRYPQSTFITAKSTDGQKLAPTLIVDLDETVLYRTRGLLDALTLYAVPNSKFAEQVGEPYLGAHAALVHLSLRFRIVAVTARWGGRAGIPTEKWLENNGFKGLPLVLASGLHPQDKTRVGYKIAAIEFLRNEGWEPVIGIGDRPSDLEAYTATGLESIIVAHSQGASPGSALHAVRDVFQTETRLLNDKFNSKLQRKNTVYISDCHQVHKTYAAQKGLKYTPNLALQVDGIAPVWTQVRRLVDERASALGAGLSSATTGAHWEEEAGLPLDQATLSKISSTRSK